MRIAFAGFRHDHILGMYKVARERAGVQVVSACEEDAATRQRLAAGGQVQITHTSVAEMLRAVDCEAVAVGDCFGRRGEILIAALQAGRHVISDKPLCTRLEQLDRVAAIARERRLCVGCQLDLRSLAPFRTMRRLLREGAIGEVRTVTFTGQHPMLYGKRPEWYYTPALHGGTINDIAIHGVDAIGWLAGRRIVEVVAARAWNARLKEQPLFQDAGQLMLRLDNGGGVIGDVSYLAPDGCGYKAPQYWRITCHGDGGCVEASINAPDVLLATHEDKEFRRLPLDPERPAAYFEAFLAEVAGQRDGLELTTAEVLASARIALAAQRAADEATHNLTVA